ncbi:cuticle protein AMP1A-like [Panulirus ornatus]|uniref:cuticle protein AMP1A-like n=1 Tax=Panulirus ornatus TaxID=150431 RepID=UPI003A88DBAF
MFFLSFKVLLVAVALAAPQFSYSAPTFDSSEEIVVVPILKDQRVHDEDGRFNVEVETGNGIALSRSGSPVGTDDAVVQAGQYSYTAPDGTPVVVKFVADENGFQPQSDVLPVAPAFPHPIPQFVLDQIAFAAAEDAARARADLHSSEEI